MPGGARHQRWECGGFADPCWTDPFMQWVIDVNIKNASLAEGALVGHIVTCAFHSARFPMSQRNKGVGCCCSSSAWHRKSPGGNVAVLAKGGRLSAPIVLRLMTAHAMTLWWMVKCQGAYLAANGYLYRGYFCFASRSVE